MLSVSYYLDLHKTVVLNTGIGTVIVTEQHNDRKVGLNRTSITKNMILLSFIVLL